MDEELLIPGCTEEKYGPEEPAADNHRIYMQLPKNAKEAGFQQNLAVLIDADNARASIIDPLLAEVAKYGVASVKRITAIGPPLDSAAGRRSY